MSATRMLHISAIEANGTLTVGVSVGIHTADGQECTRRRQLTWDSTEEPCCLDDWVGEIVQAMDDPNEDTPWVYTHGKGCEQHEESHDDQ